MTGSKRKTGAGDAVALLGSVTSAAMQLSRVMRQHFLERAGEFDLGAAEADVIYHLGFHTSMRMGELTADLSIEKSQLTYVIDRLEARHLAERRADPSDRRARLLHLTTSGSELFDEFTTRLLDGAPIAHLDHQHLLVLDNALRSAVEPPS